MTHDHDEPVLGCLDCAGSRDPKKAQLYYDMAMEQAREIVEQAEEQRRMYPLYHIERVPTKNSWRESDRNWCKFFSRWKGSS